MRKFFSGIVVVLLLLMGTVWSAGKEPEDGSIILMHDEYQTSVEAALLLIDRLKEKGYEFVTVDELIVP